MKMLPLESLLEQFFKAQEVSIAKSVSQARAELRTELRTELDEVKSDAAQVRAELDEVKSDAAQVTAELDEVKSDAAQVRAELDEVKSDATQVTAELDEAKSDAAQVRAELDEVKTKFSDFEEDLVQVEERDILSRLSGRFTFKKKTTDEPVLVWSRLPLKKAKIDKDIQSKLTLGHRRAHGEFLTIPQRHDIIRNILQSTKNGKSVLREFCAKNEPSAMAIDLFLAQHTTCSIQQYEYYEQGQYMSNLLLYIFC